MSLEATRRAWAASDINATEKIVLLDLADRAGKEGFAWPSIDEIAERTRLRKSAIYAALRVLKIAKHINPDWHPESKDIPAFFRIPDNGLRNTDSGQNIPDNGKKLPHYGTPNKEESPKESPIEPPKGDLLEGDDSAVLAWQALERGAGGPAALGLRSNLGRLQPLWLEDNKALLWARNWAELRKSSKPPTIADMEKLGQWIAAGGAGDFSGTPAQVLSKGGNVANIDAWLGKAEKWNGKGDPRAKTPAATAPPPRPAAPQIADWRLAMIGEGERSEPQDHPTE